MMNVSFDLRRDNRSMCPGCQIAFNRKKEKANKKGVCVCVCGRSVKAKRSKMRGHKTRNTSTQNGTINIT